MSMEARMSLSNVFILRMRSLGQNRLFRRNTVFAVGSIDQALNSVLSVKKRRRENSAPTYG